MSEILKGCPFCGAQPKVMESIKLNVKLFWVRCSNECIEQCGWHEDPSNSAKDWNERAQLK
jgi:hypothetical protein